jgi:hypothetical protein
MIKKDITAISHNQNLTEETLKRLHKIYQELKQIGYEGLLGSYKLTEDKNEAEFLLFLEEKFRGDRQREIVNGPFTI